MVEWAVEFSPEAEKDLAGLDREVRRRVIDKIEWFRDNFDSVFPSVLSAELREFYKLRVGDWRVIYLINWENNIIKISYIDHRSRVYKIKKK